MLRALSFGGGGLRAQKDVQTYMPGLSGLLSVQGAKRIHFYFIMVPLRKKVLKYGTPKPRFRA